MLVRLRLPGVADEDGGTSTFVARIAEKDSFRWSNSLSTVSRKRFLASSV